MATKHKPSLLLLIILAVCWSIAHLHAGWFGSDDDDGKDQQIDHLQDQLDQEQHDNSGLVVVIIVLSTGVVVALIVGTAVGSKARKAAKRAGGEEQ